MAEVTTRGVRLHVQRLGEGAQTVLFLHGLVMDNLSSWYFTVANPVARFADTVLLDLRGHGRSERPESGYGLDSLAADCIGALDALGVSGPVTWVGNSFGGLLALVCAVTYPQRVGGLVLVDSMLPEAGWQEQMNTTLGLQGRERDAKIAENFRSWLGRHSERKRTRLAKNAEALVYGTSLMDDLAKSRVLTSSDLRSIDVPTLAIYGEKSEMRDRGERLAALLPHCELVLLDGCTHSVMWEATAACRDHIVQWLSEKR